MKDRRTSYLITEVRSLSTKVGAIYVELDFSMLASLDKLERAFRWASAAGKVNKQAALYEMIFESPYSVGIVEISTTDRCRSLVERLGNGEPGSNGLAYWILEYPPQGLQLVDAAKHSAGWPWVSVGEDGMAWMTEALQSARVPHNRLKQLTDATLAASV